MFKKIIIGLVALILIAVGLGAVFGSPASATEGEEPCVPSDAWTETIEHPAVTHDETVVVQEAVPGVWANFQPNDNQAPFVGPPSYPSDERGSWINHGDVPPGHAGPDGVYNVGNPHKGGNWFYRQAAVPEVTEVITVVDEEAWTEVIEHPAVECPPDTPEQPDPLVQEASSTSYHCGDDTQTTTHTITTTEYVLVDNVWVLGEPVTVETTTVEDVEVIPCDEPENPEDPEEPEQNDPPAPTVKQVKVTVPTVIDAGL